MQDEIRLLGRLLAYEQGKAVRIASHLQVAIQPHALLFCPIAMAGEDTTIHAIAYGRLGKAARLLCVPDPRQRDDQYQLFAELAADLEEEFNACRASGTHPQIWVSSQAAATHLDILADRLRTNRHNLSVRRLGDLLSYVASRAPIAGQQALHTATGALRLHWATGQSSGEDEHLHALLTWIEPPLDENVFEAVEAAVLQPAGIKTRPEFDREVLEPLVKAWNQAHKKGAPEENLCALAVSIRKALEPIALRIHAATHQAIMILQTQGLPSLPDLEAMEQREVQEFNYFMKGLDQGYGIHLKDRPKEAAFGMLTRQDNQVNLAAAVLGGDRLARAAGRIAGAVLSGTVENPLTRKTGPRSFEHTFEVASLQAALHLRSGDALYWAEDRRLKLEVLQIQRTGAQSRVSLKISSGQRAVGLPSAGTSLDLVPDVPDWGQLGRARSQLGKRLALLPWTHDERSMPQASPHPSAPPTNLLAHIEGLR